MTHRSLLRGALGGAFVLVALGCSGLLGYGEELGDAKVQSGQRFTASFTATDNPEAAYDVWLDYEVEHTSPYRVTGDFVLKRKGKPNEKWSLDLSDSGSPVPGAGGGRTTLNSRKTNLNGKGSASETIYLVELPNLDPGEQAKLMGTFQAGKGTTLKSARIVVTD